MSDFETIRYEGVKNGVARIALARSEKRNAQSKKMLYELNDAFDLAAHDDDVRQSLVGRNAADHVENLLDDLRGREISFQTRKTAGAENARHRTAHLGGDANRLPLTVGDEDSFDHVAPLQRHERFGRPVGRKVGVFDVGPRQLKLLRQLRPERKRQIGHRVEGFGAMPIEPQEDGAGAPLLDTQFRERGLKLPVRKFREGFHARIIAMNGVDQPFGIGGRPIDYRRDDPVSGIWYPDSTT